MLLWMESFLVDSEVTSTRKIGRDIGSWSGAFIFREAVSHRPVPL